MKRFNRHYLLASIVLVFLLTGSLCLPLQAQVLGWQYENILTDVQQSGANPDMQIDQVGNIHVSYWQREEGKLVYAVRTKTTGQWDITTINESGLYGIRSALKVDNNGLVHIAFLKLIAGQGWLYYATNRTGSWTSEAVFTNSGLGDYQGGNSFPYYFIPSLDIDIQANGKPVILFFNGAILSTSLCSDGNIGKYYSAYELNSNLVVQQLDDNWNYIPMPDAPYTGPSNCVPSGDRFGEYGQLLSRSGGNFYMTGNSVHSNKILWLGSTTNSLTNWSRQTVDSLERAFATPTNTNLHWDTFDGNTLHRAPDGTVHMLYITSRLYGKLSSTDVFKRFFYTRFHPDSLGSPTYQIFHKELTGRDGYKDNFAITAKSSDSLYAAYHYANSGDIVVATSFNGGQTWTPNFLYNAQVSAPMKMDRYQDSLFLLVYDEEVNALSLSRRSFSNSTWITESVTTNENRATVLSADILRSSGEDEVGLFYDEKQNGTLSYGERLLGNWTFETIATNQGEFTGVSMGRLANGEPCAAFAGTDPQTLQFTWRDNGNWQFTTIASGGTYEDLTLIVDGNVAHLSYFLSSEGEVHYATATPATASWTQQVVDASSQIVGKHASMVLTTDGILKLVYSDIFNAKLRFATLAPGGSWQIADLTGNQEFNPVFPDLKLRLDDRPVVAFRDASNNNIILAEQQGDSTWTLSTVTGDLSNLVGAPLKLVLDDKDRPWILYNFITSTNEMRLVRRDGQGNWNQVSVLNNPNQIANVFDFQLVGEDFYVVGKQNRTGNNGIGLLFAANGVNTLLEENFEPTAFQLYPNPLSGTELVLQYGLRASGKVHISLYNLQGQRVHLEPETSLQSPGTYQRTLALGTLRPGLYFVVLESNHSRMQRKLVISPR